jgi:hypothetical protein
MTPVASHSDCTLPGGDTKPRWYSAFILSVNIDEYPSDPEAQVLFAEKLKYFFNTGGAASSPAGVAEQAGW